MIKYTNEIIFFIYSITTSLASLLALKFGKETLIALISSFSILLNLLVLKQINLFRFDATACDALAVGITLSINLLQEFFDYKTARKAIWISFFCSIFYLVITRFHLLYIPNLTDTSSNNYYAILNSQPRLILASLFVYLIVQSLDAKLYQFILNKFKNTNFILRNYTSTAVTQLLDTVLFSFLGLYKINPSYSDLNTIFQIILISYIIKLITIIICAPILSISKKFIAYP